MKKLLPLFLALVPVVFAATPAPQTNVVTFTVSRDGGPLSWYVDVRGSNLNTCTAPFTDGGRNGPCRQPQAAIDKVPPMLRHLARVFVDAGTYEGFVVSGFSTEGLPLQGSLGLAVIGTTATFLPDGGALSGAGTLSGIDAGDASLAKFTTLYDTTQTWATDSLIGYDVEILTGTGAGGFFPIFTNDATSMLVASSFSGTAAAGSTYAIRDVTSVVTSPVLVQAGILTGGLPGTAQQWGIAVVNNAPTSVNATYLIQNMKVAITSVDAGTLTGSFRYSGGGTTTFSRCMAKSTIGGGPVSYQGPGRMSWNNSVIVHPLLAQAITINDPDVVTVNANYMSTSGGGGAASVGITGRGGLVNLTNNYFVGDVVGTWQGSHTVQLSGANWKPFTLNHNFGIRTVSNGAWTSNPTITLLQAAGLRLDNCDASCALCIQGAGATFNGFGNVFGTNNFNAIAVDQGGRVKITAASTITGSNSEIILDGVIIDGGLATMRAATPKIVSNVYGSMVHE